MNFYITFSGRQYHETTKRIVEDAPGFGADQVVVYDDVFLRECRPDYWERVRYFRDHPGVRGVDFFCFKPFVVLDAYRRLSAGDVMLFTDADTFPIAPLAPLYDLCRAQGGVVLFNARGCVNELWTKRDVFTLMGCDDEAHRKSWQAVGRFMLYEKVGAFPVERFLGQWLGYTANPFINTFDPSALGLPDAEGFRQNRCEQSVLTNLAVTYGVKLHREACEFGCWDQPDDHPDVPEQYRGGIPHQFFSQVGGHTFDPANKGDGSSFRNVFT